MITNNSTIDNELINKAVIALNLSHLDICISESENLLNQETLTEVFGQTEYEVSMGYADIIVNASISVSSKEVTVLHELCHVADRDCETILDNVKMNSTVKGIYYTYHEKSIENYARALYLLIRGGKHDGLQDFREFSEIERDSI